ncbi:MAG: CPXCG motif-containing cysteine-rich protein [Gammaproteobacteria bacterium]|nr:CPXCG motif-containing cysteine-rich protein [Gammaproteobacteria bacterium]MBQ0840989.1 CPXCG motif-containing cysteine-rich protein [Gammaproteobacteria bacterium]
MSLLETINTTCPYCAEAIELVIDCSEHEQRYIEDCFVCCRPISLEVLLDSSGYPAVQARHEDDV